MILPVRPHGERLTEIRERCEKATQWPLKFVRYDHGGARLMQVTPIIGIGSSSEERQLIADFYDEANREFYYAAREDVPWLLDQLQAALLRAEQAEQARDRLKPYVQHIANCPQRSMAAWVRETYPCNCGHDEVLK